MQFGVQHAVADAAWVPEILDPASVTRFAQAAEAGGFGVIGVSDHPAPSGRWVDSDGEGVVDPFTMLGFCAAVTESIRLLTFLLIPPYRNPFQAAHQVATLDVLSRGRVTVGLGAGYLKSELRAMGTDPGPGRLAVFDQRVAVMREAWSGADVSAEGEAYSARAVRIQPAVVQQPHPPLWLHGNSPFGLQRAAQWGQGWLGMITGRGDTLVSTIRTTPLPDLDVVARRVDELRVATVAAGRQPDEVDVILTGLWPHIDVRTGWDTEAYLAEVDRLEKIGVDWMIVSCCGDDPGAAVESLRRFGEEIVVPR